MGPGRNESPLALCPFLTAFFSPQLNQVCPTLSLLCLCLFFTLHRCNQHFKQISQTITKPVNLALKPKTQTGCALMLEHDVGVEGLVGLEGEIKTNFVTIINSPDQVETTGKMKLEKQIQWQHLKGHNGNVEDLLISGDANKENVVTDTNSISIQSEANGSKTTRSESVEITRKRQKGSQCL